MIWQKQREKQILSNNNQPSIKKNIAYRTLYDVLSLLTPLITAPYISRTLGADGVGLFSYSDSLISYFNLFAFLGTAFYGAREIAIHRDEKAASSKLFWEIELMKAATSLICFVAWIVFSLKAKEFSPFFIALSPVLISSMLDISWFYTGKEMLKYTISVSAAVKIITIICLFIFVKTKDDLIVYFWLNSATQAIAALSMWLFLPRFLVKTDWRSFRFKHHLHETLIYFVPSVASAIYSYLDKTLLGLITRDVYQNGYYEQATKIINLSKTLIFSSVNIVLGSRISYLFAKNEQEKIRAHLSRSMDYILLMCYGCMFGIAGVAKRFVPVFFGEGYEPVETLLYLMAPLLIIIAGSNCLSNQYYTPCGRIKDTTKYIIIGSCINLCLNLLLIPIWKSVGAVVASIAAELVIAILHIKNCNKYLTVSTLLKLSHKRLIAGMIMCVSVSVIGDVVNASGIISVITQIISGIIIYGVFLMLLKDSMIFELLEIIKSRVQKGTACE